MAWDFSTDPAFERELAWMRTFVREELWPLETVVDELGQDGLDRIYAPLQEQVKARGLWAAHLPPELGGQGFGQVKLGLMHEILGTTPWAPNAFGCQAPDSGNSEILALAGTPEQRERYLHPLLAGDLRSAFSMTEPNAGADPTLLRTRAVRDGSSWVISGHKWFSSNASIADFLIVMAVTDPDARPHQRASMFLVDTGTPGVEILRDVATMEHPQEEFGSAATRRSATRTSASPRRRCSGPRAEASSPSSAWARGASTTACAGSASRGAPSTCSASARRTGTRTARRSARSRPSRTGSPTRRRRCRPPAS
jgi:acyl-CoA dehydrogenase